jgi:hypothetical protein
LPSIANRNCGSKLKRLLPTEGSKITAGLPSEKEGMNENPFCVTLRALRKNNVLSFVCARTLVNDNSAADSRAVINIFIRVNGGGIFFYGFQVQRNRIMVLPLNEFQRDIYENQTIVSGATV